MIIENKNPHFGIYIENGQIIAPNSTEENLLVAEAVPSDKRKNILLDALEQADLDNDVVFVTAWESLSGYYILKD